MAPGFAHNLISEVVHNKKAQTGAKEQPMIVFVDQESLRVQIIQCQRANTHHHKKIQDQIESRWEK
jgi:hypothetical protein